MKSLHQLRTAREQKGWSQSRVAEALGVTTRTVSRWEQGQAIPYPYYRQQLSLLFDKNEEQLGFVRNEENTYEKSSPSLQQSSPPPQGTFIVDSTIPHGLRRFSALFGRDHLLASIQQRLLDDAKRFIALHGLPGTGKTALAVSLATDPALLSNFPDGVLWAGLGSGANIVGHLARWGKLLGITPIEVEQITSITAWGQAVRAAIGTRRFLIIIDDAWNLEHALALTVGGPNSSYLLTSRLPQIAFNFARTGVVEVPELEERDALLLLASYVPQVVQQRSDDVLALVRAVGTLPLALTLMGQYLASQAISGQPRRLNTALHYLHDATQRMHLHTPVAMDTRSSSSREEIPLSLSSAIALSVQQLDAHAQESLSALAIFPSKPNSFTEEAALVVSQASVETLDTLWDAGLLESSGAGRYTLHQTIVDYAYAQGSNLHARPRLVNYMLQFLQLHEQDNDALEHETANVLVALDAAIELNLHYTLLQRLTRFVPFMQVQGLELVHRLGSSQFMSQILTQWGNLHLQQQNFVAALSAFNEAVELNKSSNRDPEINALAQYGLAQLALIRGDRATALRLGSQSLSTLEMLKHNQTEEVKRWLYRQQISKNT